MTHHRPQYTDYGYTAAGATWSHRYLDAPLLRMISRAPGAAGDILKVLDLGCGNGALVCELLTRGHDAWGIDASRSGIAVANGEIPGRFFVADLATERFPPELPLGVFDVVVSMEVIEHLYSPRVLVALARRALRPGGSLILTAPYHGYVKNVLLALSGRLDTHFTALWDGGHIKFFSRATITELVEEQGFRVTEFVGAGRVPWLWKSMLIRAELS
jgi:2-polyprenyl-3-methyl-5-hydroxy-6-metoxy-1,4-benzoquinol methylase